MTPNKAMKRTLDRCFLFAPAPVGYPQAPRIAASGSRMSMLTFTGSKDDDLKILEWMADHQDELGKTAADWFRIIRASGSDVMELSHNGYPTVCVGDFPFAYVGVFKSHVNVGFFYGADLPDPVSILEGSGRRMRHVKVKLEEAIDADALETLISEAYLDIKRRIDVGECCKRD